MVRVRCTGKFVAPLLLGLALGLLGNAPVLSANNGGKSVKDLGDGAGAAGEGVYSMLSDDPDELIHGEYNVELRQKPAEEVVIPGDEGLPKGVQTELLKQSEMHTYLNLESATPDQQESAEARIQAAGRADRKEAAAKHSALIQEGGEHFQKSMLI